MPFSYPPSEVPVDINDNDDIFKEYSGADSDAVTAAIIIAGIIASIFLGASGVAA